jgi:hypothetical protein
MSSVDTSFLDKQVINDEINYTDIYKTYGLELFNNDKSDNKTYNTNNLFTAANKTKTVNSEQLFSTINYNVQDKLTSNERHGTDFTLTIMVSLVLVVIIIMVMRMVNSEKN